ncbi:MAG: mechanosensitive ion channel domain-containing protein [Clostridia bacterium]
MESFKAGLYTFLEGTGINIMTGILVLFAGLAIIKLVSRISRVYLQRTSIESTTMSFIVSIINFILYLTLSFIVISLIFPNASTEMIAILGTATIAIGLALQGSLSNFASGIIIIFTKPFKEGDWVEIADKSGVVKKIGLLQTELLTASNQKLILGNSKVINNDITNYSTKPTRRFDMDFSVAYGSDIDLVKKLLTEIATKDMKILQVPKPYIKLAEQGESALIFKFRVWVNVENYWDLKFDLPEIVYRAFCENKIVVPYKTLTLEMSKGEDK